MGHKGINEMAEKGYNICIVIFESIDNLLSWLKFGKTPNHGFPIEFNFLNQAATVKAEIGENIDLCDPENRIGILITYYCDGKLEISRALERLFRLSLKLLFSSCYFKILPPILRCTKKFVVSLSHFHLFGM